MKTAEEWMSSLNQAIRPGEKFPVNRAIVTTEEISAIQADAIESMRQVLMAHGRHRGCCAAFPATSQEQIDIDCDCGLSEALKPATGGQGVRDGE